VTFEEIAKELTEMRRRPMECPLCGAGADQLAVFLPSRAFATRLGLDSQGGAKQGLVAYGGCSACQKGLGETEYTHRIELTLGADARELGGTRWEERGRS
jgi:hypothetical protein